MLFSQKQVPRRGIVENWVFCYPPPGSKGLILISLFILQISVGLVELNNEHNELKIKRASSLPISVRKSATDLTVKRVAIEKHLAHNKNLRVETNELNTEWIPLHPDLDVVLYIPGTRE